MITLSGCSVSCPAVGGRSSVVPARRRMTSSWNSSRAAAVMRASTQSVVVAAPRVSRAISPCSAISPGGACATRAVIEASLPRSSSRARAVAAAAAEGDDDGDGEMRAVWRMVPTLERSQTRLEAAEEGEGGKPSAAAAAVAAAVAPVVAAVASKASSSWGRKGLWSTCAAKVGTVNNHRTYPRIAAAAGAAVALPLPSSLLLLLLVVLAPRRRWTSSNRARKPGEASHVAEGPRLLGWKKAASYCRQMARSAGQTLGGQSMAALLEAAGAVQR
jgi:hypothetical protein